MYARFLRWASDRIDENGVIAFVSNNSFINSRTFDGFRKVVKDEFNYLYMIDLKGNARTSGERRRQEGGNIFHDQIRVGIAIYFLIKIKGKTGFQAFYDEVKDYAKSDEKMDYIVQNTFENLPFEHILPDKDNNWINLVENDWDEMIPVADKAVKNSSNKVGVIFDLFSLGLVTNRDDWVYDIDSNTLQNKVKYLIDNYNSEVIRLQNISNKGNIKEIVNYNIKWTRALFSDCLRNTHLEFEESFIKSSLYRPFTVSNLYFAKELNEMQYQLPKMVQGDNLYIAISGTSSSKPFATISTRTIPNLDLIEKTQCLPLYRYDKDGNRHDNITDWALAEFRTHYADASITKTDIFHYVYAVLHHPAYRAKYELNLKRSFPRIPYYAGFRTWAEWGKELMELHIGFEAVEPYPLRRMDSELDIIGSPKAKLKADKEHGSIILDEITSLTGIPDNAWDYKLGNRSALEWILDQYKEKKPKDPTIAKLFNTYRFADYKEKVIDLLMRVCTVSVKTMEIIGQMPAKD